MRKLLLILILCACGYSATRVCPNAEYATVNDTLTSADVGDTITVPADTVTWTSALAITKGIVIQGSGMESTLLVNGISHSGSGDFLIMINLTSPETNPFVGISGFTFDANLEGGCVSVQNLNDSYEISNFRIHHNKIMNTLDAGDSYMSVRIKGNCFGLIDSNQLVNNRYDFKIYGNDQNSWDRFPGYANVGTKNYIYIENNTSTGCNYFILTSGEGARWVYRYNTADISQCTVWDAHGNTMNDGVVAHEAYENDLDAINKDERLHDLRGGCGIIYNNRVAIQADRGFIQIREEDCYQYKADCVYPGIDSINNTYLWNNTNATSDNILRISEIDSVPPNMIEEDRDYWTDMKAGGLGGEDPTNFTFGIFDDRPASSTVDDCYWSTDSLQLFRSETTDEWTFVYEPYTYPHPLAGPAGGGDDPAIDSISPLKGKVGYTLSFYVSNLIDSATGVFAKINNLTLSPLTKWSNDTVQAEVPTGAPRGLYTNPWIGHVPSDTVGLDTAETYYRNYVPMFINDGD